jgi:SHS2 domain-containing protein
MAYRWVEHTGELELAIDAPTERAVFEDGFEAMRELLAVEPREASPKGATYHRLAFEPADGGWRATVVLDV